MLAFPLKYGLTTKHRKQSINTETKQQETIAGITAEIDRKTILLRVSVAGVWSSVEPEVPVSLSLWFWFSPAFLGLSGLA